MTAVIDNRAIPGISLRKDWETFFFMGVVFCGTGRGVRAVCGRGCGGFAWECHASGVAHGNVVEPPTMPSWRSIPLRCPGNTP